jgi:hypothetical protein
MLSCFTASKEVNVTHAGTHLTAIRRSQLVNEEEEEEPSNFAWMIFLIISYPDSLHIIYNSI